MKFSTKEDMEIPIETVFEMLSDFEAFERAAMRRGVEVTRVGDHAVPKAGLNWKVRATIRGKLRDIEMELDRYDTPTELGVRASSDGMQSEFTIELVALSRNRTRMRVALDIRPRTLPARLLMQSAKLAKNTLNKRYKTRVAHFAEDLEERHKRALKVSGTS